MILIVFMCFCQWSFGAPWAPQVLLESNPENPFLDFQLFNLFDHCASMFYVFVASFGIQGGILLRIGGLRPQVGGLRPKLVPKGGSQSQFGEDVSNEIVG